MNNEMRLIKFETLIKEINNKIGPDFADKLRSILRMCENTKVYTKVYKNLSMLLIYDYDELNEYGKIILEHAHNNLYEWENKYSGESLKDSNTKIKAAKEFIKSCKDSTNAPYNFIFWAMLVLTVDDTDKEEKLSLICDFARMLKISDYEMMDILQVIKVIYHAQSDGFQFNSETIPSYFSRVLDLYN